MEKWSVKVKFTAKAERILDLFAECKEDAEKYASQTLIDASEENCEIEITESSAVRHVERTFEIGIRAKE